MPRRGLREKDLQKKIREYFVHQGCLVVKLTMLGGYGSSGWPDLLILEPEAKAFFIEVKTLTGKLTPLQQKRHQQLRNLGFRVLVVRSLEDLECNW